MNLETLPRTVEHESDYARWAEVMAQKLQEKRFGELDRILAELERDRQETKVVMIKIIVF